MRFLSSSSSSASSTITATSNTSSFDGNGYNSRNATAGCIAGVFRRLLCLNSLPTYPADHIKEIDDMSMDIEKLDLQIKLEGKIKATAAAPGVVARLMGLEPLPQVDFAGTQVNLKSISRSRSMNSVESSREFKSADVRHRRAKSFREVPTYLELEDENFFILSFEKESQHRKLRSKGRRSEKNSGEVVGDQSREEKPKIKNKRRESVHERNKENMITNQVSEEKLDKMITQKIPNSGKLRESGKILRANSYHDSHVSLNAVKLSKTVNEKQDRGRKRIEEKRKDDFFTAKRVDTDCNSENSSPNSVLDFEKLPLETEYPTSVLAAETSRLANSKSRRTLSEELDSYRRALSSCSNGTLTKEDNKFENCKGNSVELRKKDHRGQKQNCFQLWSEVCRLAERELMQSSWICDGTWKPEDCKEIGGNFGSAILDELLTELIIDQLLASSS